MLKGKTKEIANELRISDLKPVMNTLKHFVWKKMKFRVLCSESDSPDSNVEKYCKTLMVEILIGYSVENQFNFDETGFLY